LFKALAILSMCSFTTGHWGGAQNNKSDAPTFKVLLIANILVRRYENIETGILGGGKQVAVAERVPPSIFGFGYRVTLEKAYQWRGRIVIKQYAHRTKSANEFRGMTGSAVRGCVPQTGGPSRSAPE
jgi:hypothetical protein